MRTAGTGVRGAGRDARGGNGAQVAIASIALVALTVIVFSSVRHFDFVNWDDQLYLTENANVQAGLSWSNARWALTTTHSPYWHPLTWLSHMLDVTLFGMDAGWHHVTSLVIHIGSTLLLFGLLRRMTRDTGKSAFVAAIFAVHPLHVESVAWLAERKDVLSTLLLFVTMWMYVRYVEHPGTARYAAVVVSYALALMAKPMVVTLPFVLLLLDVWPLQRIGRAEGLRYGNEETSVPQASKPASRTQPASVAQAFRPAFVLLEKLPLLALAVGVSVATLVVQKDVGAVAGLNALPIGARITNTLVGYVTYLRQAIWPARLAAFYPLHPYAAWVPALAGTALAVLTTIAFWQRKKRPYAFVGWLWFVITLAPVIGLMQSGEQATADRFMYVPLIGLAIIVAWGGASVAARVFRAGILGIALVLAYAAVAHAQTGYWSDSVTLWRHATDVTDANYVAYENLGQALRERGDLDGAIANYSEGLRLLPPNSAGHESVIRDSLGLIYERKGRPDTAEPYFAAAAQLNPRFAEAQNNLGNALAAQGKFDEAVTHYRAALAVKPALTEALVGLGGAFVRQGRPDDAAVNYREALRLDPKLAQAHNGLGTVFTLQHRDDEAMAEFTRALELKPDLPSAHLNIAIVLLRKNDTAGARRHLEAALSIDPGYEPARNVLARIR